MGRPPNLSLDPEHWLKDQELSRCDPATRGIWMDLICHMHTNGRTGEISGSAEQLADIARCYPEQFINAARDLKEQQAAHVRFDGSVFYLRNRRMFRQAQQRKGNAERQMRYREERAAVSVTPQDVQFERFWVVFPKGRKKSKASARTAWNKAITKADPELIIKSASEYAASQVGQGKYVKMPESWLNQECWSDDRESWRDLDATDTKNAEFRNVTKEEFLEAVKAKQFKVGPTRSSTDPRWVLGTLTSGIKIQCKDYWLPKIPS